jgi:hypothetical protein
MSHNPYEAPRSELEQAASTVNTYYLRILYLTVGVFLILNLISLLHGLRSALLAIAFQVLVLASVFTKRSWAYIVVRLWSAFWMFSGISLWLAVLLRGKIIEPTSYVVFRCFLLIAGFYFFKYAKSALSTSNQESSLSS